MNESSPQPTQEWKPAPGQQELAAQLDEATKNFTPAPVEHATAPANERVKAMILNGENGNTEAVPVAPEQQVAWAQSAHNKGQLDKRQYDKLSDAGKEAYNRRVAEELAKPSVDRSVYAPAMNRAARRHQERVAASELADAARGKINAVHGGQPERTPVVAPTKVKPSKSDLAKRLAGDDEPAVKAPVTEQLPSQNPEKRRPLTLEDQGRLEGLAESASALGDYTQFEKVADELGLPGFARVQILKKTEQAGAQIRAKGEELAAREAAAKQQQVPAAKTPEAKVHNITTIGTPEEPPKPRVVSAAPNATSPQPEAGKPVSNTVNSTPEKPVVPATSPADTERTRPVPAPEAQPTTPKPEASAPEEQSFNGSFTLEEVAAAAEAAKFANETEDDRRRALGTIAEQAIQARERGDRAAEAELHDQLFDEIKKRGLNPGVAANQAFIDAQFERNRAAAYYSPEMQMLDGLYTQLSSDEGLSSKDTVTLMRGLRAQIDGAWSRGDGSTANALGDKLVAAYESLSVEDRAKEFGLDNLSPAEKFDLMLALEGKALDAAVAKRNEPNKRFKQEYKEQAKELREEAKVVANSMTRKERRQQRKDYEARVAQGKTLAGDDAAPLLVNKESLSTLNAQKKELESRRLDGNWFKRFENWQQRRDIGRAIDDASMPENIRHTPKVEARLEAVIRNAKHELQSVNLPTETRQALSAKLADLEANRATYETGAIFERADARQIRRLGRRRKEGGTNGPGVELENLIWLAQQQSQAADRQAAERANAR